MPPVKNVDEYIATKAEWAGLLEKLRSVMLSCGLEETIKWGAPSYGIDGRNVAGLAAFKNHVSIWFWQGALLSDPQGVLYNAQSEKTKALRQWRFHEPREVKTTVIRAYVKEARDNAVAGKMIRPEKKKSLPLPAEMKEAFKLDPGLKKAFGSLSQACQREYIEYVSEAKQPATRQRRMAKSAVMILEGQGLNDRYK